MSLIDRRVEVNMLEAAIALVPDAFAYFSQSSQVHGPSSRAASSQCFAWVCNDGKPISIHLSVQEKFWLKIFEAMDVSRLGTDERFATRQLRIRNYTELASVLGDVIRAKPRSHWEKEFTNADIPYAPVHSIAEVPADPQVKFLGTFEEAVHPTEGRVTGIRSPICINGVRGHVIAPPTFGEHTNAVLDGLAASPKSKMNADWIWKGAT